MSKWLRKLLYTLGTLVVLTALALGVARTSWFQGALKSYVATKLENLTGGRVEIGRFHFSLVLFRATFRGLVVHGKHRPGESPLFSSPAVMAQISPVSPFRGKLVLRRLEWDEAEVHLYTRADGTTNLSDSLAPTRPGSPPTVLTDLSIQRLTLARTQVFWDGQPLPLGVTARDVAILVERRSPHRYSGSVASRETQITTRGRIFPSLAFVARFEVSNKHLSVSSLSLRTSGLQGEGSLNVDTFAPLEGRVSFRGEGAIPELAEQLGVRGINAGRLQWTTQARFRQGEFEAQGRVQARQILLATPSIALRNLDLSTDYVANRQRVELSNL